MQRSSWESLTPTSFKNTLYIPSLKISVTAGSFIRYSAGEAAPDAVGRIVEVVSSLDLVPDNHALIHLTSPAGQFENESPLQYAKVNVFKDRQLFPDSHFPADNESFDRWERIVQLDKIQWIPSNYIVGLAFVAMEEDGFFDDCQGMCNFYVAKYRITEKGEVSIIPRHTCPPFPGRLESFQRFGQWITASLFLTPSGIFGEKCNESFVVLHSHRATLQ
ncbi:hypothetical protein MHU86_3761 [Fragilaria crotonensis]|nr:hypothetical protein MHU86_3761 [Fragilaria crotonensis]